MKALFNHTMLIFSNKIQKTVIIIKSRKYLENYIDDRYFLALRETQIAHRRSIWERVFKTMFGVSASSIANIYVRTTQISQHQILITSTENNSQLQIRNSESTSKDRRANLAKINSGKDTTSIHSFFLVSTFLWPLRRNLMNPCLDC